MSTLKYMIPLAATLAACQPPEDPDVKVHVGKAKAALEAGRTTEAISALRHAQQLSPRSGAIQRKMMRARAYLVADSPDVLTTENVGDLRYEFGLMAESDAQHALVYNVALGHIAILGEGDRDAGKAYYQKALALDPASFLAHAAMGQVMLGEKDGEAAAKEHFEKVLAAKESHTGALVGLARLAMVAKKHEDAVGHLELALKKNEVFIARYLLAQSLTALKKWDDATKSYQLALQANPKNAEVLRAFGEMLLAADKPADAEQILRAANQVGGDAGSATSLGFALAKQKKNAAALTVFGQLLAAGSGDPLALFGAATASDSLGKKDQAKRLYDKLLSMKAPEGEELRPDIKQLLQEAKSRREALDKKRK